MKISLLTSTQEESINRLIETESKKFRFETDTPLKEYVVDIKEAKTDTKDRMVKSRLLWEIRKPDFSKMFLDGLIKDLKILNYLYTMAKVRKQNSSPDFMQWIMIELLKNFSEDDIRFMVMYACSSKIAERQNLEERIKKSINRGDIRIHPPERAIECVKTLPPVFSEMTQKGRVYRFLHYYRKYWTGKEIADKLILEKSTINRHIKQFLKEGLIEQDNSVPPKYRCIHHL